MPELVWRHCAWCRTSVRLEVDLPVTHWRVYDAMKNHLDTEHPEEE